MTTEQQLRDKAMREAWLRNSPTETEVETIGVAHQDDNEDWPILSALFAGLAVALIINTFISVLPV